VSHSRGSTLDWSMSCDDVCIHRFTGNNCEIAGAAGSIVINPTPRNCSSGCGSTACAPNSYNPPTCNVSCLAQDTCQGHYTCNQTDGSKICLSGWGGSQCTQSISASTSNCCESGGLWFNGFCFCPAGKCTVCMLGCLVLELCRKLS
jgi:Delta serrate ligand